MSHTDPQLAHRLRSGGALRRDPWSSRLLKQPQTRGGYTDVHQSCPCSLPVAQNEQGWGQERLRLTFVTPGEMSLTLM